jgi:hypothetical protein
MLILSSGQPLFMRSNFTLILTEIGPPAKRANALKANNFGRPAMFSATN